MTIAQPVIETERLRLVPSDPTHASSMLRYQLKNRAHFAPWDPIPGELYYTTPYWTSRLKQRMQDWFDGRGATFILFHQDAPEQVIGNLSVSNIVRGAMQGCTVGYGIDHDFEGQGLMREALESVIEFGFDVLKLHRIQANYQPHNQRSAALLERLGFTVEGLARQYLFLNGAWRDHVLTSLTNHDFNSADLRA